VSVNRRDLGRDLRGALAAEFAGSSEIPLKYAQRVVERADASSQAAAFLQSSKPADFKSYSAHSDQIFGIMTQMLEEFEAELKRSQGDESKSAEDYAALAKAKNEQIARGKEKLDELEGDNAENMKALSDAKENLELTRKQRSADIEFLRNLKLTCNDLDAQWEKRSKTRSAETVAVAEAIGIITEDDNREMLAKSVTFTQIASSASTGVVRRQAADLLRQAAKAPAFDADDLLSAWHSRRASPSVGAAGGPRTQLSSLAVMVQLDSFTKVKEMMDKMVAELKKQQVEEVEFKAYCTKELNANEKTTYAKNEEREDLEAKIESLAATIKKLNEEIAENNKQIADTKVEIKKASQNREKENAEFQAVVADQRATQEILKKALNRLADFYKKGIESFAQKGQQTPPVQFNKYKNNAGASPVMGLIEQIIGDSKQLEQEETDGEFQAQADYESFVKDSNNLIAELSAAVVAKTKAIGAAKLETADAKSDHSSTVGELESLEQVKVDLHSECDFTLKNFDIRQKARLQEMDAIGAAKAILSGERAQ
jgi:septal ring factor EnvC (AmiA/AmiB activator)